MEWQRINLIVFLFLFKFPLSSILFKVKVPSKCLPQYSKASIMSEETGDSPLGPGYVLDEENEIPKVSIYSQVYLYTSCLYHMFVTI